METQASGSAAGWYADPKGSYESRYWDGMRWTAQVVHQGVEGTDTGPVPGAVPASASVAGRLGTQGRDRARYTDAAGAGLLVGTLGIAMALGGLLLPWFGDVNVFTKPSGMGVRASDAWGLVLRSALLVFGWTAIAMFTICGRRRGKDPAGKRYVAAPIVSVLLLGLVYVTIQRFIDEFRDDDASATVIGAGPWVLAAGIVVASIGMVLGRRRVPVAD